MKKTRQISFLILFFIIFISLVFSEDDISDEGNILDFYYDFALFKTPGETNSSYLDVFVGIPIRELNFTNEDNRTATYLIGVRLLDSDGMEVITDFYQDSLSLAPDYVDTTSSDKLILEQLTYKVESGKYTLEIGVSDGTDTGVLHENITSPIWSADKVEISDVQLISQLTKSDNADKKFYKNGYITFPNPSRIYEVPAVLSFYYELYNLNVDLKEIPVRYVIAGISGKISIEEEKLLKLVKSDLLIIDSLNIDNLSGGLYNLFIEIPDEEIRVVKEFFVYEEQLMSEFQALQFQLMLEPYTDKEAIENAKILEILTIETDMNLYYQLDNSLKPYFVYKFWETLDPDLTTEVNEFKEEFESRLTYVNENLSSTNFEGWETDMGRVYLKYGPPDFIESEPTGLSSMIDVADSTFETEPTEVWEYHSGGYDGGGCIFIFVDFNNDGTYNIFSSTEPGYGRFID